jgi:hypothetical protein
MYFRVGLSVEAARGVLLLTRWTSQSQAAPLVSDRHIARHHCIPTIMLLLSGRFDAYTALL